MRHSLGLLIPTYQGAQHLERCLLAWQQSPWVTQILVVDSSSDDETVACARALGCDVHVIPYHSFNHGATRELWRHRLKTDLIACVSQDAYIQSPEAIAALLSPLKDPQVGVSFARQISSEGSWIDSEQKKRLYPSKSWIWSFQDSDRSIPPILSSNACSIWRQEALNQVGGFPSLPLGEDAAAAARLALAGWSIAYVAEARVIHSHRFSLKKDFHRYFCTGYSRRMDPILSEFTRKGRGDLREGLRNSCVILSRTLLYRPHQLISTLLRFACRWLGYQLGARASLLPVSWRVILSGDARLWLPMTQRN